MKSALFGALALGYFVISLYFFRFWKKVKDRLFMLFGFAFIFLAVERLVFICATPPSEVIHYLYCIRLIAFLFILWAIAGKNSRG
jgi:hypothetical protein